MQFQQSADKMQKDGLKATCVVEAALLRVDKS